MLKLAAVALALYPIKHGTAIAPAAAAAIRTAVDADLRGRGDPEVAALAGAEAAGELTGLACPAARANHFVKTKANAAKLENLSSWVSVLAADDHAWKSAHDCFRIYNEPQLGAGFAIYGGSINGAITVLEVWRVPEIV